MKILKYAAVFILTVIMILECSLVMAVEYDSGNGAESDYSYETYTDNNELPAYIEGITEAYKEEAEDLFVETGETYVSTEETQVSTLEDVTAETEEDASREEDSITEESTSEGEENESKENGVLEEDNEEETEGVSEESSIEETESTLEESSVSEDETASEETIEESSVSEEGSTENESNGLEETVAENFFASFSLNKATEKPAITYSIHMQTLGWLEPSKNGGVNGNPDIGYRTEAFNISETGMTGLDVNYRAYVIGDGWTNWVKDGETAGTTGQRKPATMLQIVLTGNISSNYDIYYSVYAAGIGWLDWAKNGASAGVCPEYSCNIEALKIKIVSKGGNAPGATQNPCLYNINISYYAHIQTFGDTNIASNGEECGTTGKYKRMEGLYVYTDSSELNVKYRGYIQGKGWGNYVYNGKLCGTTGEYKRIEALQISLTGAKSDYYNVYYRVHVQSYGWLDWAKDGEPAGTIGYDKRIEAVQIMLVPISHTAPGATGTPFVSNASVSYVTHAQTYGWQDWVSDGETSGVIGSGKRLEAIKIDLENTNTDAKIKYRTHVQTYGWQDWVYSGKESGTTGKYKRMEAIEIQLVGNFSRVYDVYYRVYVEGYGWLGWAKNGETAGTTGKYKRMEAIEIKLVGKGGAAPGETGGNYISTEKLGIDVSRHNGKIDWNAVKETGIVNFAIIRCGYRDSETGVITEDSQFKNNIKGALENNIPVGIYFYSQAITKEEAIEEANWVINKIKDYKITYPVIFDFEHIGENRVANLSYIARNNIAVTFLDTIKAAGYQPMMYASQSGYIDNWDVDTFVDNYDIWVARYRTSEDIYSMDQMINEVRKGFNGSLYSLERAEMWQFAQTGRIPGISEYVDLNICYKAY